MNKIFLWDDIECTEKSEILKQSSHILELGDILYMANQCIPVICPSVKEVFGQEFMTRMHHLKVLSYFETNRDDVGKSNVNSICWNSGNAFFKTHVRFSDIATIYCIIRNKLLTCKDCKDIAKMAIEICSPYEDIENMNRFVAKETGWDPVDCFRKEAISYLTSIYVFQSATSNEAEDLNKVFQHHFGDDDNSWCKDYDKFSSQLNNQSAETVNAAIYNLFYPDDRLLRKRDRTSDKTEKGPSEPPWCTSIYHLIIKAALGTTVPKYNPFFEGKLTRETKLNIAKRIEKFLQHFYLLELNIFNQSIDFRNTASYILERMANANLINSIYRKIMDSGSTDWIVFSFLTMHPLVQFRYELIKKMEIHETTVDQPIELLFNQIFFYFPLLCRIFNLLIEIYKYEKLLVSKNCDVPLNVSYELNLDIIKANGEKVAPVVDFPTLKKNIECNLYECIAKRIYAMYSLSLNLPNIPNIIYGDHWYNSRKEYLDEIYKNSNIRTEIEKINQQFPLPVLN